MFLAGDCSWFWSTALCTCCVGRRKEAYEEICWIRTLVANPALSPLNTKRSNLVARWNGALKAAGVWVSPCRLKCHMRPRLGSAAERFPPTTPPSQTLRERRGPVLPWISTELNKFFTEPSVLGKKNTNIETNTRLPRNDIDHGV